MAKRICKGNIGESFFLTIENVAPNGMTVILLDYIGGEGAQAMFSDPYYPDGRFGKWRADRFNGRWTESKSGNRVIIK